MVDVSCTVYPCTSRQKEKSRARKNKRGAEKHMTGPRSGQKREVVRPLRYPTRARSNPAHAQPRVPRRPGLPPLTPDPSARAPQGEITASVSSPPLPTPTGLLESREPRGSHPYNCPPFPYPRSLPLLPQIPRAWMDSVGTNRSPLRSAAAAAPATRSSALPRPHRHPALGNR